MSAFLLSPLPLSPRSSTARLSRRSPSRSLRHSSRSVLMCTPASADDASTSVPADTPPDRPPEPYPGFYADMTRMGLSDEEAIAQALKAQKQSQPVSSSRVGGEKNLLKPDGTPYAPWMANVRTDYDKTVIKKKTDATGRLAADPQLAELSGVGLQWKMLGDELELSWATGAEEGNLGFVVYRRKGGEDKWDKIADYRDRPGELASKGVKGGLYSFLVEDVGEGSWVYRVSDVDSNNQVADLAQVLVEIEKEEDKKVQKIALAALLAVLAAAVALGLSLDPLSGS